MGRDARGRRLRWVAGPVAVAFVVVAVVVVGWLAQAVFLGGTLASGDGWRIQAKWSPFGSSVTYEEEARSGGAGGLASPGLLSESIGYVPPDEDVTYLVGVLPADAVAVRVGPEPGSSTTLHRVGPDVFYLVRIEGVPVDVRLEAVDEGGRVVDTAQPPVPGPRRGDGG